MKIKKFLIIIIFSGFALNLILSSYLQAEKRDDKISDKQIYSNILVRVFEEDRLVEHLTAPDFRVRAEKKPLRVTGFQINRKAMKLENVSVPSRYFVLSFKVHDFNPQVQHSLTYLFDNIFKKSDQLLVCVNAKTLSFENLAEKDKVRTRIEQLLEEESQRARNLMNVYHKGSHKILGEIIAEYYDVTQSVHPHYHMKAFADSLKRYLNILKEYKKLFLLPDLDSYYQLSRLIDKTSRERWMIHFYQKAVFPELSDNQRSAIVRITKSLDSTLTLIDNPSTGTHHDMIEFSEILWKRISSLDDIFGTADDFPVGEMSKIFYQTGVTFHAIFLQPERDEFSPTPAFKSVYSELGNGFEEITKRTGGSFIDSNNLESALETISRTEDVLYVLTYASDIPPEKGQLKVEASNENYELFYDDNIGADYIGDYFKKKETSIPHVQIQNIIFKKKTLSFEITDFLLKRILDELVGKINIRVVIRNEGNQVIFDQKKTMIPQKNRITISIDFDWLKKGDYSFSVEVDDLMTEKTSLKSLQIRID
ncbi:MAG: hypothetical protein ACFFCW_18895 [Candidatus Hodarchaeota archaeon]